MDTAGIPRHPWLSVERLNHHPTPMKTIFILTSLALASCVSTITTTTLPDGTVTVIEQRGIDQASVVAATEISKTIRVTPTK
jgi:hypothetical protein